MKSSTRKMVITALGLAIGLMLPFLTGQIPTLGSMMLPMHLPVLIVGFICGWPYGLMLGAVLPILRSLVFAMPPMYPTAIAMAFELGVYGCISGLLYKVFPKKPLYTYLTLISSMLGGRVIWGAASYALYAVAGNAFTWQIFLAGAFINAIPGIILQIVLVPLLVMALKKNRYLQ
ncbi:MAG: ECF transporter S component [Clostridia bacterium]|jgi:riboflavin transporter FmnP